jgi:energy-converting hydrogenase Eha subunit A
MTRPTNSKAWSNLIFKPIAIAMGIAVVVLQVLGSAPAQTSVTLLGIGLFSLALSSMQSNQA